MYHSSDVFHSEFTPAFAFVGPLVPSEALPPHSHEFIEILVIASGSGTHLSAQGAVALEPGSVVVVRPGAWHEFDGLRDTVSATICISPAALRFDLAFLRARPSTRDLLYTGPLSESAQGVWVTRIPPEAASQVLDEARQLEQRLQSRPDDLVLLLGHLITVLGAIASGMPSSEKPLPSHPAVATVLHWLERNPERPWTVADLGALVNLGAGYLTRIFRADLNISPMAYLARIRAEKAANLLTVTDLPVSHVGAQVGWPDPTYFARRFHALIGMTPRDYRRRMRAPGNADRRQQ